MPRFALSEPSIGSTTTTVAPSPRRADLLADDRDPVDQPKPREDRVLGRLVDRGRLVAAFALADDRLALGARRQRGEHGAHVLDARAADREPVSQPA